ncbi:shikimate kinase [Gilvibacter sediminis]|uniref:shikimate kinase n=1 Tax=Gilvibacter sediminis TaxID=379071 RepID=UPI00235060E6|nr:shikimate kinase [Gilvibacter sediminis]MDC7999188.1 shikimate kinase [Gilvibacter sediminis]
MIVLLGYMGSGKSLIGKKLAEVLQWPYCDLDVLIEQEAGQSIPEFFKEKGEIKFRILESQVLQQQLADPKNQVLALGGGTPCYAGNMDKLLAAKGVQTIYLKTQLDTLLQRLWPERAQRPLIAHLENKDDLKDFVRKHLFDRSPYYMQAEHRIDTSEQSAEEVVKAIVAQLF